MYIYIYIYIYIYMHAYLYTIDMLDGWLFERNIAHCIASLFVLFIIIVIIIMSYHEMLLETLIKSYSITCTQ